MARVAIYSRVSRDDMHAENQLMQLHEWCARSGHTIVAEFTDKESGGKSADQRKGLADMLAAAHRREFDLVLIWALDRLSREGMAATLGYLQRLATAGVAFHSFSEPALCSDNELVRDILLAVMSALAKAERLRISARTKAGLDRVRKHGSKSGRAIGRPTIDSETVEKIRAMVRENPSIAAYAVSRALRIDPKTVRKYLPSDSVSSDTVTVV